MALDKFQPYLFVSAGEQSNKFLTPVISPDGIASFQAQRAQELTGLTVRIDPIQSGTGDPSPTNIRPISGRTGLTVTRAGKNVLSLVESEMISAGWNRLFPISLKAGTYIISCQHQFGVGANLGCQVALMDEDNVLVKYLWGAYTFGNSVFVGSPVELTEEEAKKIKFILFALQEGGGTYNDIVRGNIQLELGTTATAYEPYTGASYPISWQTEAGTVYGGTLDVVSGVLTVDRGIITLDGTQSLGMSPNNRGYVKVENAVLVDSSNQLTEASVICDRLKPTSWGNLGYSAYNLHCAPLYGRGVAFRDDTKTTAADWTAYFTENHAQFSYKLATPQTYQLTPTGVHTLAGYNQIYSDAGPIIDIKF